MEVSTITQTSSASKEIRSLKADESGWLSTIPETFRSIELKNCIELPESLRKFGWEYLTQLPLKSLYFFGQWGSGKTTFAFALIREIMRHSSGYFWPRYFTARELDNRLLNSLKMEGGDEEYLRDLADMDLIFIDDLDKISPTPRFKSQFFEIINRRLLASKPTFVTSNLSPQKLSDVIDGAVISRMNDETKWDILEFPSKDLRRLNVKRF
jgi:DNA replication protein DnaC